MLRLSRIGMLACASVMVISHSAAAQTSGQSAPPSTQAEQPPEGQTFGDIIVTAQRRNELQRDVPISITAFNSESLAKTGVTDARGLMQITPGLNFQQFGSSAQPLIRGIGSTGGSVGDSSNVSIYIDGVYQPFQAANFLRFGDLDRIEVLKGPQGTLFGRNAAGGAISITTLKPSLDAATGKFSAGYSRFNEVELNGFVSVPLSDTVAASLSGNFIRNDGFRRDIFLNRDVGYLRSYGGRAKLLIEPDERTSILLTGHYRWSNDLGSFGNQPLDGNTVIRRTVPDILLATEPNTSALSIETVNKVKVYGGSLSIERDLGFAKLTSLTAFANARQFVFTDSDLTPAANLQTKINFGTDMISQDLTLTSTNEGPLKWLLGGTYYREQGFLISYTYGGLFTPAAAPPLTAGRYVPEVDIKAYAAFAELTYSLTDRLTVIVGGRFSNDKPSYTGSTVVVATGQPNPATRVSPSDSFSSFTPRVAMRYAVTPTLNAYASYSRGFKSGVFNSNGLQATAVKPETVDAFEAGMKGAVSPTFSFDASAFYYDYKNLQQLSFGTTPTTLILRNAAKAEIYGFEANATALPLPGLTLRGGFAYVHGEYKSFPGAQGFIPATNASGVPIGGNATFIFDASGHPMIRTPRVQVNGTVAYETGVANGGKLNFNLTASRTGKMYHDVSSNTVQPAFTVVNASIAYTTPDEHWRASIWGNNIFDETYIAGILISGTATAVTYSKPATYGVKIEYMF
ncbi:iron complex outermembrane recepter protein [Novosphingobium sp. CF614]|uniref:TonB-dependent receptor n=1 Tax=Novosphingobium sp. CF614 TaxID=1884364 RepID=UPI0008EC8870|nr:TonB-dependent receptor [Novosphingobium sp. CF614]SFG29461.1 iron complex outermembrane recepter protein [Novosphingobium sp. CF614]